jgi:transposase-like protein
MHMLQRTHGHAVQPSAASHAIVLLVVILRLRYKLRLRDLAEVLLERGLAFTHETVRAWEARFAPLITQQLRAKRQGKAGRSWPGDETHMRIGGQRS